MPLEVPLSLTARLTLAPVHDFAAVGRAWRALEARADPSFFQSWTWVGCLAERRFPDPLLLTAERGGEVVGLALLNRRRGRLFLGGSGDAALDAVYVEHNGPLLARGHADLLADLLRVLLRRGALRLAGVTAAVHEAARAAGVVRLRQAHAAPFIDLAALPPGPDGFLSVLSANTRYQLRRSDRRYAVSGPITLHQAADAAEALTMLAALAALHQASWTARGQQGAFANPFFAEFHRALIARALPRGEAALLRIAAGGNVIGYLYNFRHCGRVLAYQSGFDYAGAGPHGKPGLTCHHAAIVQACADGSAVYDFLAGDHRYKTSLAHASVPLVWLDAARRGSAAGLALWLLNAREKLRAVSAPPDRAVPSSA
jgi:CelD/BcsL family acetyltransferase involved in cellulose biosynthesis